MVQKAFGVDRARGSWADVAPACERSGRDAPALWQLTEHAPGDLESAGGGDGARDPNLNRRGAGEAIEPTGHLFVRETVEVFGREWAHARIISRKERPRDQLSQLPVGIALS